MIILYVTDIFLILNKYNQLVSLVNHFKPNYVILNGSILCPHNEYYDSKTVPDVEKFFDIFKYVSKYAKVIVQFGNFDTKVLSDMFTERFIDNENIINITNSVYYDIINFIGISGVVTNHYNSDWLMHDGYYSDPSKTIGGMLKALSNQTDVHKTVYITTTSPIGINLDLSNDPTNHGSYDIRRFAEWDLNLSPRLILSAGFPDNFSIYPTYSIRSHNGCVCVNPSQPLNDFYYCILNIDNNLNVTDIWHPKKFYSEELRNG